MGSLAAWVAIAITFIGGAVGYGALTQRVTASEAAIRDARPVSERLASAETEIRLLKDSVDALKSETQQYNANVTRLVVELQVDRARADSARRTPTR
jgi:hypothetical protein